MLEPMRTSPLAVDPAVPRAAIALMSGPTSCTVVVGTSLSDELSVGALSVCGSASVEVNKMKSVTQTIDGLISFDILLGYIFVEALRGIGG